MVQMASSLLRAQETHQFCFQFGLRPFADEKPLLPAREAAQQLDLRAFYAQSLPEDVDERVVRPALVWRRRHGNLQSAARLAHNGVAPGAWLSPDRENAAFDMFGNLNHEGSV